MIDKRPGIGVDHFRPQSCAATLHTNGSSATTHPFGRPSLRRAISSAEVPSLLLAAPPGHFPLIRLLSIRFGKAWLFGTMPSRPMRWAALRSQALSRAGVDCGDRAVSAPTRSLPYSAPPRAPVLITDVGASAGFHGGAIQISSRWH